MTDQGTRADQANRPANERGLGTPSTEAITNWLVARVAAVAELDPTEVDPREPFIAYGLDSSDAVGMSVDLADWLGLSLPATLTYDFPTIEALARHLAERMQTG